jgi:hypothetical protein
VASGGITNVVCDDVKDPGAPLATYPAQFGELLEAIAR